MKEVIIIPLLKFENTGFPFKIQTIKSLVEEQNETNDAPHSHNYYEMIWVIKGKGILFVDMQQYDIENNMIFCLSPNQTHHFQINTQMEGFVFSFTESFFSIGEHEFGLPCQTSLFQLFFESQVTCIQPEMETDMKEIALKIMKEFENGYRFRVQLLKQYFRIFLIYLTRQLEEDLDAGGQTRETELVKKFLELLDKCFREKKMVNDYAMQLSVSSNYLNRTVKKNTGHSAGHHIRQRVVLEAKRLGRYSDAGMKEIAYNLGFSDSAHFSRLFKSVAGTNFSDFKKVGQHISMVISLDRA